MMVALLLALSQYGLGSSTPVYDFCDLSSAHFAVHDGHGGAIRCYLPVHDSRTVQTVFRGRDGFTGQGLRHAQDRLREYREYRDDRGQRDAHRALFGPRDAHPASRV